jgi:hypothetical protein
MDLDNVTSSVVVGTKGVLTFDGVTLQASTRRGATFQPGL